MRIQTVRFHYSAENFLVSSIRFYTEISAIPRYSAIFSSHSSIDSNSAVSNDTQKKIGQISALFEDPLYIIRMSEILTKESEFLNRF